MADTIVCPIGDNSCNCNCNCQGFLTNNRKVTVNSLIIDGNLYTFSYTITNKSPEISNIIFCIDCPEDKFAVSSSNTTINITGNPAGIPESFTECFTPGCESSTENSFYVDYDFEDKNCCRYQGIKIDINPGAPIIEIEIELNFTVPDGVVLDFCSGNLKVKSGSSTDIMNNLCIPGCCECIIQNNVCEMWQKEKNILESNKDVFTHFSQLILPEGLDLNTITVDELEKRVRNIAKIEKSSANIICNTAKVLEKLNKLDSKSCNQCTLC